MRHTIKDRTALVSIEAVHDTKDGGIDAVAPRVARTGIQLYRASEIGMVGDGIVRVYRDESEVFAKASVETFDGVPVTLGHPPELVTADNYQKYAKGHAKQDVLRDGEHLRIGLRIAAKDAVTKVKDGSARQLSVGYTCLIDATPGVTPTGEPYDARQTNIVANHIALVPEGRAGTARIGDGNPWGAAPLDSAEKETAMADQLQTVVFGDEAFAVNDKGAELHKRMTAALDAAKADAVKANDKIAKLEAQATADADKIADLESKLTDSQITPQKLAEAAKARQACMDAARKLGLSDKDMDEMTEEEMKAAAVKKKMGDKASAYTADQIAIAFDTLSTVEATDSLAGPMDAPMQPKTLKDAYADRDAKLANAWKKKGA